MKKVLLISALIAAQHTYAQDPDDVLRNSWFIQNGTARNMAIGGAMGSLGGDITAAHVNPAGLGFFNTGEFVLSAGWAMNKNKFGFRGTDSANKRNIFHYGASGVIIPIRTDEINKKRTIAFSVNQLASFNNRVAFNGRNNYSSFSEQYLEELTRDGANITAAEQNYIFGSSLAFRTYLIDSTNNGPGGTFDGYRSLVNGDIFQNYNAQTSGGYHEIAAALATNSNDKFYWGATLAIPIVSYKRELTYREADATGNTNNDFSDFVFTEQQKSFGIGMGLKFGAIYKPQEFWRLGLAVHTPQIITFRDEIRAQMTTNTENYAGTQSISSDALNSGNAGRREYVQVTPYRIIASGSYVFREVSDTRKQRAFLTADIEFVNYQGGRFYSGEDEDPIADDYYKAVAMATKDYLKGNFNFRLGGELKFNIWMVRLGGGYYGSPYEDKELKAHRIVTCGGLGYRNKGIFIDATYNHNFVKDVNFPYRLNDKANTFAERGGGRGNVMLTLGFKF